MNWDWHGGFSQVPVIVVFTKFDQLKRDIRMKLEDEGLDPETDLLAEVERIFERRYVAPLGEPVPFIRFESEGFIHQIR